MKQDFINTIKSATGAESIRLAEAIQELWSGYGAILRYDLFGAERKSVVVKHISFDKAENHPRGWNSEISHQRKLKSYQVEQVWYEDWAESCNELCKIPDCLAINNSDNETLIVLEDLDDSGYMARRQGVSEKELRTCLRWLANFHAVHMNMIPDGLWEQGTYWHLDTRPDELKALADTELKSAAEAIDITLKECPFQTIVHGDAKLANFCFTPSGEHVAAVDFQYVGGGCGMKDLAYFIGSCLSEKEQKRLEPWLLDYYFSELKSVLKLRHPEIDQDAVEQGWRALYHVAIADFHRFLKGWSPGHWKQNSYTEQVTKRVVSKLAQSG